MTKILGFSGKKQGGKSSACDFLAEQLNDYDTRTTAGIFAMADPLKKVCVEVLGLRPEQVYGTDEEKNSLTRYRWEDLPHYFAIRRECFERFEAKHGPFRLTGNLLRGPGGALYPEIDRLHLAECEATIPCGFMTSRQVQQEVGTGIFRRMYAKVWNEACLRAIKKSNVDYAFVGDIRFPDEVQAVQEAGGRVIRFTLDVFTGQDQHKSETSLDHYEDFDQVVDNSSMTVEEKNEAVLSVLNQWRWFE